MADPVITTLRILGTRAYINGARASARAIREVGKAGDETGTGMQLLKGTLGGVTGALGIMSSAAKSAATILGALTLYGAKVGLEFDASIERAQIGMETLLGSSKLAKKTVQQVQDFAVKAPMLSVADAVQSSQMLIGAGLKAKEAVPTMKAFSDTISAMGRRPEDLQRMTYAFMQMMSKGKITAEELRGQLGEIFPASKLLAKGMGISMAELQARMKEGSVKGMKPIRILLTEMEKEFGGATERSAQTFSGMLNNMKEQAKVILGDIFRPLFVVLRDRVFPWVQKIGDEIGKWAKHGGPERAIRFATRGFTGQTGAHVTGRALGQAGERPAPPKPPKGIDKIMLTLGQLAGKIVPELQKQFKALWDALKPAEPFWNNVLKPLIEGFAVGLYQGIIGLIPIIKIVATVLGWIGDKAKPLKPLFQAIGWLIGFAFGPGKLGIFRLFGKVLGPVVRIFGRIFGWLVKVSPAVNRVIYWFLSLGLRIPAIMRGVGAAIIRPFVSFGKKVAGAVEAGIGAAVSAFVNFGKAIGKALGDAIWGVLPGWARSLLSGGLKIGKKSIKAAGDFFGGGPTRGAQGPGAVRGNRNIPRTNIPANKRAGGGWTSGATVVGERGPELAYFPDNTFIYPKPEMPQLPGMNVSLYAPIYWKGREVAAAVAEDTADKKARR